MDRTDSAVMDMACYIFIKQQQYQEKEKGKELHMEITPEVIKAGQEEWSSMSAECKDPYVTEAKTTLADLIAAFQQEFRKSGTKKKTHTEIGVRASKRTKEMERTNWAVMDIAECIFMIDHFLRKNMKYFKSNRASKHSKPGLMKWIHMEAESKAPIITEAEEMLLELVNAYKETCIMGVNFRTTKEFHDRYVEASKKEMAEDESRSEEEYELTMTMMDEGRQIFMCTYGDEQLKEHPEANGYRLSIVGSHIWMAHMTARERAPFVVLAWNREAEIMYEYRREA